MTESMQYQFIYLNHVPYFTCILIFALIWSLIPLGAVHFDIAMEFFRQLPSIWIPVYMIAGLIIPIAAFLKLFSCTGTGILLPDCVEIALKHSSNRYGYDEIKEVYYSKRPRTEGLHIRFSLLKEITVAPPPGDDDGLYMFYTALYEGYLSYHAKNQSRK